MNILYLSDIHFGRELFAGGKCRNRDRIQNQLIQTVSGLPQNMKPDYIVVTGDIAWTGGEEEYNMAYDWFSRLLNATSLNGERLSFCAGNHDINRKIAVQVPLSSIQNADGLDLAKIDDLYKYENIHPYGVQLQAYNDFCHRLGVIPYEYYRETESPETDKFGFSKQWYSYTVGTKDVFFGDEKYRLVAFNTAMLSGYERLPDDENFIGLPQIEQMLARKVIGKECNSYQIALFHHSERFLNTNEMNSYSERPATLHKLLANINLALCGHTETGAVPVIRRQENDGLLLNGGAAYYSDEHPNSFSILRIEPQASWMDICTFIYTKGTWTPNRSTEDIPWKPQAKEMRLPGSNLMQDTWKFTLFTNDAKKETLLRHVDYGFYANGTERHYHYVNKKDVTRILDVWGDEDGVHFQIAPGRERSIAAMLEFCGISHFVDQQLKRGCKQVEYEVTDPKGTVISKGIMPAFHYTQDDYTFYELLHRLRRLEEAFHVRFSATNTASVREQCAVTILEDFLEDGGGVLGDTTSNIFVYLSEKRQEFQQVYDKLSKKEAEVICIGYAAPMVCDLFGARIKLGNCRIIVTNLIPCNLAQIKRQADTFLPGDRRMMSLKFLNDRQQIVLLKADGENKHPAVQSVLQQIREKSIRFEVEPQELVFGIDIFKPDEKEATRRNIKLRDTLSLMNKQLWELFQRR